MSHEESSTNLNCQSGTLMSESSVDDQVAKEALDDWAPRRVKGEDVRSILAGHIPPGAANPMLGTPSPGTISYLSSTTSSPPPQGAGSDPHRLLDNQRDDRLSAAISLVLHPDLPLEQQIQYQRMLLYPTYQQSQEQLPLSSAYPTYQPSLEQQPPLSSYPAPGSPFGQPQQTPSQTQLAAQSRYRGYAKPSTLNQNYYGRV